MARLIVARGLEELSRRIAGLAPSSVLASMTWDNSTGAGAAFTSASSALGATTFVVNTLTNSTLPNQTIRCEGTLTTAELNGLTIGRIALHTAATASVTTASTFLFGGVDQQSILKTSEYSLVSRLEIAFRTT